MTSLSQWLSVSQQPTVPCWQLWKWGTNSMRSRHKTVAQRKLSTQTGCFCYLKSWLKIHSHKPLQLLAKYKYMFHLWQPLILRRIRGKAIFYSCWNRIYSMINFCWSCISPILKSRSCFLCVVYAFVYWSVWNLSAGQLYCMCARTDISNPMQVSSRLEVQGTDVLEVVGWV